MNTKKRNSKSYKESHHLSSKKKQIDISDLFEDDQLSPKISHMVEPWIEDIDLRMLSDCAAIAWNGASGRGDGGGIYTHNQPERIFSKYEWLLEELEARKRELYPNDSKWIKGIAPDSASSKASFTVFVEF